jgi:tetratricopeptide (TPR) repeat protein
MAHLGKTRLVAASVFVLVLGLQPVAAQSGKGSGTNTTGNASRSSGMQATPDTDLTRNVFLSGNVVIADGSPPPEPVAIERVCGADTVRMGYTDASGFFSFPLVQTLPVIQNASENGRDRYTQSALTPPGASIGNQPPTLGNALSTLAGCELRSLLAGFQSTSVMIPVTYSLEPTSVGTIVLLRAEKQGSTVSTTSMNTPRGARKAYERATAHIKKHKLMEAQAELEQAIKAYPRYAAAWTDLGWVRERQNHLDEAREAFSHAREADDNFVPAYVGLASVAVRQSRWTEAQELSTRATQLDGADFPVGFYYNALANFQLGQLDNAEKSARMAERLDTRHSLPPVILLLGSILATKHNYAEAAEELKLYMKVAPTAANAEKVRQRLVEFERLSTSADPSAPSDPPPSVAVAAVAEGQSATPMDWEEISRSGANSNPAAVTLAQNWAPPDVDHVVPPVAPGVHCPVHAVVSGVSSRAKELMDNLQQFSATERIEHVPVDKAGNPRRAVSATFKYVAEIREASTGGLAVNEYRDGSSSSTSLANVATSGVAAHALMFHPSLIDDLAITCEGLGSIQGTPAWQLHFVQQPGRPPRFRYYSTPKGSFPVEMKGRAWVAVDSYQVMRMETDLAQPIKKVGLQKDHMTIDYRPVEFSKRKVQLWLPQTTDLYLDFAGKRFHRQHSFSDFELFWVDVAEKTRDYEVR